VNERLPRMNVDMNRREKTNSPEHMDKMVSVIEIKSWIAFATVLLILGATLIWGFFGTMQLREDVSGVLVKSGKIINIYAADDSVLLDFSLKPEKYVERDQVIARIEQLELANEINLMLKRNAPEAEIEMKRDELMAKSQIKIYDSGRVVEVYAHVGDYVQKGMKLATISKEAPDGKALECLLYVPASQIKDIKKGMSVNIYPASVSKKTYGNMAGTVAFIGEYPVTRQYMFDTLASEELAREFLKNGACYEVYINLEASAETETGYKWTTSLGPNKKFGNLTQCDASIITEELRPIDVFFFGNF
jgi:multidrug resistance efflux pump